MFLHIQNIIILTKQNKNLINNFFLFIKGHDTAAMGLCFALLLLGEHKDIQVQKSINISKLK